MNSFALLVLILGSVGGCLCLLLSFICVTYCVSRWPRSSRQEADYDNLSSRTNGIRHLSNSEIEIQSQTQIQTPTQEQALYQSQLHMQLQMEAYDSVSKQHKNAESSPSLQALPSWNKRQVSKTTADRLVYPPMYPDQRSKPKMVNPYISSGPQQVEHVVIPNSYDQTPKTVPSRPITHSPDISGLYMYIFFFPSHYNIKKKKKENKASEISSGPLWSTKNGPIVSTTGGPLGSPSLLYSQYTNDNSNVDPIFVLALPGPSATTTMTTTTTTTMTDSSDGNAHIARILMNPTLFHRLTSGKARFVDSSLVTPLNLSNELKPLPSSSASSSSASASASALAMSTTGSSGQRGGVPDKRRTSNAEPTPSGLEEIKIEDVTFERCIGGGKFGKVYKALWISRFVAVKCLRADEVNQKAFNDFAREIRFDFYMHMPYIYTYIYIYIYI
ncbi:hypothetical protein RFI_25721 [Reticulomyxa filosa]|uniref:Protein kinase domain-containing protein n=1 Tax=Reticulomyxa filosa TaxID=46433 RepID=X6MCP6_RETFI|nr:hypothetical protein RFI_25721 [Reticulomyxa filosa]|eukprot:ETO11654.1 hypothetical protein RFI_25721 [Reticulomyxa filosa]